jgi:hypothetical protein
MLSCILDKTHNIRPTYSKPQIFVQDLALVIADLNTPQPLAAPQQAGAAQMHQMDVHQDSSQDDTEHDSEDNTRTTATKSSLYMKILQTQNQK